MTASSLALVADLEPNRTTHKPSRSKNAQVPPQLAVATQTRFTDSTFTEGWPEGVCCVDTEEHAKHVVDLLLEHGKKTGVVHAVDTEVTAPCLVRCVCPVRCFCNPKCWQTDRCYHAGG